jgi:hypothetical protein
MKVTIEVAAGGELRTWEGHATVYGVDGERRWREEIRTGGNSPSGMLARLGAEIEKALRARGR